MLISKIKGKKVGLSLIIKLYLKFLFKCVVRYFFLYFMSKVSYVVKFKVMKINKLYGNE